MEKMPVSCNKCWRCQERRVNDYVGRMLCEAATSDWAAVLTLTYAPRKRDLADKVLHPPHFQKVVRSLRRRGHSLRYFVAGEYGDLRGRAHFHCILFGMGQKPVWRIGSKSYPGECKRAERDGLWPQQRNFHMREWPHGHVFCDWNADHRAFRYACKYLLKDDPGNVWVSLSKKPPLGATWFADLAERNLSLGALPSSFEYFPPGGKPGARYLMQGATRRDYLQTLISGWQQRQELPLAKLNEWVRDRVEKTMLDKAVREGEELSMCEFIENMSDELEQERLSPEKVARYLTRTQQFVYTFDPCEDYYV